MKNASSSSEVKSGVSIALSQTMSTSPPKYEPLNRQQDDEEATHQDSRDQRKLRLKIIGLGFCLGILIASFLILVVLGVILHSIVTHIHPISESHCASTADAAVSPSSGLRKTGTFTCGSTADEARALGCKWDIMTMSWEHPDCFDADLTREFEELGPWKFYHSSREGKETPEPDMLSLIPYDEVSDHPERMWTDRRYHIMHCIYAWKMLHRAVERGWKVQGELASYHHTEHCSKSLGGTDVQAMIWLEQNYTSVPMDAIVTKVNVQYPTC